jgi:hypothetical protein
MKIFLRKGLDRQITFFPHPEERALARVSKDGHESMRCIHPSRRGCATPESLTEKAVSDFSGL